MEVFEAGVYDFQIRTYLYCRRNASKSIEIEIKGLRGKTENQETDKNSLGRRGPKNVLYPIQNSKCVLF